MNAAESEKVTLEALEVLKEAEWRLLRTPAANFVDVRDRAMVVQDMFNKATVGGEPTDNVHRHMLDVLVHEILSPVGEA
jgi:hypothetical protein